jgi:hypothetical protein
MARSKRFGRKLKQMFSPKVVMAVFIIFILVSSAIGFIVMQSSQDPNSFKFNEYSFKYLEKGGVELDYHGEKAMFYLTPQDALSFTLDADIEQAIFSSKQVKFSFDPSIGAENILVIKNSLLYSAVRGGYTPEFGLMKESYLVDGYDVITCDDATELVPVIILQNGPINSITMDDANCITVESAEIIHTIKFYEKMSYTMLGVLPR